MAKPAILFDLDGTLWDSSREVALSWSLALEPYGLQITTEDVRAVMGKTLWEIADLLFPDADNDEKKRRLALCAKTEEAYLRVHGASPYPGLIPMLDTLRQDYALAIVSNCQMGYIETFLDYYGLWPYFSDTENAGRTGKPKGENIRLVLERNGWDHALYVGDTLGDQQAAKFAGIPFVHAAYGFGVPQGACPSAAELMELPALVRSLL